MPGRLPATVRRMRASVGEGAVRVRARVHASLVRARAAARRPPILALSVVVLVGLLLRASLFVQWRPALIGFPDTGIYLQQAIGSIFWDPLHLGGYGLFLRVMHDIRPHLSFVALVQHGLGLASGLLLFGAVRRAGLREWIALVPAAVVGLSGSEIFIEDAVLSEALFIFLVDLALYAVVRTWSGSWSWAFVAGLMLGTAAIVRSLGLVLATIVALVVLVGAASAWRPRLVRFAALIVAATIPVAIYAGEQKRVTGFGGLTTPSGYFDLYGRVAEFADCSKFDPPKGTKSLCVTQIPVSQRQGPDLWEFTVVSPAVRVFGEPDVNASKPGENAKLREFALAAIFGQPLDYLEYVGRDLVRIVDPGFSSSPFAAVGNQGYGPGPQDQFDLYFNPGFVTNSVRLINEYYPGDGLVQHSVTTLEDYERATRLEGPAMAFLLLLALLAPFLTRGPERRAAVLFGVTAFVLLVAPPFLAHYEYRFVISAFGPLAATAAIGGWALLPYARSVKNRIAGRMRRAAS